MASLPVELLLFVIALNPFWPILEWFGAAALPLALLAQLLPAIVAWLRPLRDRARYSILMLSLLAIPYGGWLFVLAFAFLAPRRPAEACESWPDGVAWPEDVGPEDMRTSDHGERRGA